MWCKKHCQQKSIESNPVNYVASFLHSFLIEVKIDSHSITLK